MKTDVSKFSEFRKYYLSEFEWFDGLDTSASTAKPRTNPPNPVPELSCRTRDNTTVGLGG